jgi:manganese/zinc/iron transport system permease protein
LYLIQHADIAPTHVDRDADAIEHVLEPQIVAELEELLQRQQPGIPRSPHDLSIGPDISSAPAGGGS